MRKYKILNIIGSLIGLTAFALSWYWYDWKLALITFLALFGNNLEQARKK